MQYSLPPPGLSPDARVGGRAGRVGGMRIRAKNAGGHNLMRVGGLRGVAVSPEEVVPTKTADSKVGSPALAVKIPAAGALDNLGLPVGRHQGLKLWKIVRRQDRTWSFAANVNNIVAVVSVPLGAKRGGQRLLAENGGDLLDLCPNRSY